MRSTATKKTSPRNSHGPILPTRLAHALSAIAQTLPNPWDESTDYFVPFSAELDSSKPTTAGNLRQALDVGRHFQLDLAPVDLTATGANFGDDTLAKGFARRPAHGKHGDLIAIRCRVVACTGSGAPCDVRPWATGAPSSAVA